MSHDLRTPLASIKASVCSLRQTDVHWSARGRGRAARNIEQNADRLDALVGNLLDMSRLQAGSLEPFLRAPRWTRWPRSRCAGWTTRITC